MTVKELIEQLSKFDGNKMVFIYDDGWDEYDFVVTDKGEAGILIS